MTCFYFIHPQTFYNSGKSVARNGQKNLRLNPNEKFLLENNLNPVLDEHFQGCRPIFKSTFYIEVPVSDPEKLIRLNYQFTRSSREEAIFLKIVASSKIIVHYPSHSINLNSGTYFIPRLFPLKIVGKFRSSWFNETEINIIRDLWILKNIKKTSARSLLEIGLEKILRLANKIRSLFPNLKYQGVDTEFASKNFNIVKNDILKNIEETRRANIVIFQESIEHLPLESISDLLEKLKKKVSKTILITTPNKDFNQFIGLEKRKKIMNLNGEKLNSKNGYVSKRKIELSNLIEPRKSERKFKG